MRGRLTLYRSRKGYRQTPCCPFQKDQAKRKVYTLSHPSAPQSGMGKYRQILRSKIRVPYQATDKTAKALADRGRFTLPFLDKNIGSISV